MEKNPSPDRATVAEEVCQDAALLGQWAEVCANPDATENEIRVKRQMIAKEIDETEALKIGEIQRKSGRIGNQQNCGGAPCSQ